MFAFHVPHVASAAMPSGGSSQHGLRAAVTFCGTLLVTGLAFLATNTTDAQSLTTPTTAPLVLMAGAWWNEPTGMEISAQINPESMPTSYHFQYGPCATVSQESCSGSGYAYRAPASAAAVAGSGDQPLLVHQQITGLATGSAYHFRAVATNSAGTSYGEEETIVPQDESYVIEQVTPAEKQAHDFALAPTDLASPSGNAVVVGSLAGFENPEESTNFNAIVGNLYVAHRAVGGWRLFGAAAPTDLPDGFGVESYGVAFAPELEAVAGCGTANKLESGDESDSYGFVCDLREASGAWRAGTVFQTLRFPADNLKTGFKQATLFPASRDLSHVFYDGIYGSLLAARTVQGGEGSIYEFEGLGTPRQTLRLVNVNDAGEEIGSLPAAEDKGGFGAGSPAVGALGEEYHAVSEDGQTVFFEGLDAGGQTVYARLNHAETVDVSNPTPSQCTRTPGEPGGVCNAPAAAEFQGASAHGTKVFFTTTQQLVNADTDTSEDLYEYDFERQASKRIVQVSGGGIGDPSPGSGAEVQGVLSTSSDGSHVYFVARGVLSTLPNARGQSAVQGADNVYGYDSESEVTKFVGDVCSGSEMSGEATDAACPLAVSANDDVLWEGSLSTEAYRGPVQETPDGNYLVFASYAKLVRGGPEAATNDATQVYRYDFQTGELLRVSIGEPSFPESKNGNLEGENATIASRLDSARAQTEQVAYADGNADDAARAISEDGETVIFVTPMQLQANDVNGAGAVRSCPEAASTVGCDVYVWHYQRKATNEAQGVVTLVSDGQAAEGADQVVKDKSLGKYPSWPVLSASGESIFFGTRTPMVPVDGESEEMNVYVARIGGGLAGPPVEASCSGEACQGTASAPPSFEAPATLGFSGGVNLVAPSITAPVEEQRSKGAHKTRVRRRRLRRALKACRQEKRKKKRWQKKGLQKKRRTCAAAASRHYDAELNAKARKSDRGGKR